MRTNWNLNLLYNNLSDPRIEKDVRRMEGRTAAFVRGHKNTDRVFATNNSLLKALNAYEKFLDEEYSKPLLYTGYLKELDSGNEKAEALGRLLEERYTKASNQTLFFELALAKVEPGRQKQILKDKRFARFKYVLQKTWRTAKYNRSEPEEKILTLLTPTSYSLWVEGLEKALSKRGVFWKGDRLPLPKAENLIKTLRSPKERAILWRGVLGEYMAVSDFAESELNAVVKNRRVRQNIRGYKYPAESSIISFENRPETVEALVGAVSGAFEISRRFYSLKKKLFGLKKLTYADRAMPMEVSRTRLPFEKAAEAVGEVFGKLHPNYRDILGSYLKNGQIDVYPKVGKAGGAFCSFTHGLPTYVLLNHVDDFESALTLAHEMGHAIHSERSRSQGVLYEGYSTAVAETASTFFETAVFETLSSKLPKEKLLPILHNRLQDDIQTVFRQIAFYNFETELHERIGKEGSLSKEKIAELLNKHLSAYLGKDVALTPEDGYQFVTISHFRRPFYVYTYAFGQLISRVLLRKVKEDPGFIKKVDAFLSAGGSASPEDIFKNIGLNVTKPDFFDLGIKSIAKDLSRLERLANS